MPGAAFAVRGGVRFAVCCGAGSEARTRVGKGSAMGPLRSLEPRPKNIQKWLDDGLLFFNNVKGENRHLVISSFLGAFSVLVLDSETVP